MAGRNPLIEVSAIPVSDSFAFFDAGDLVRIGKGRNSNDGISDTQRLLKKMGIKTRQSSGIEPDQGRTIELIFNLPL
jgi:hypothetical protein